MLAKELKVDIDNVKGTGPYGRITDEDVRAAAGKPAEKKPEEKKPAPAARRRTCASTSSRHQHRHQVPQVWKSASRCGASGGPSPIT